MGYLTLTAVGGDLADNILFSPDDEMSPKAEDVVVAVEAAPINNADLLFAAGVLGVDPEVPAPLGGEGVGRVTQAGANVDPTLVGRQVLILPTFRYGTWAATTVVPARSVIAISAGIDPTQLALLGIPATAYALLNDFIRLEPGDWIGLNLANGAVGRGLIGLANRAAVWQLPIA